MTVLPKLSVIIVSYNAKHYLHLTLSCLSKINQSIPLEIIVVDNLSSPSLQEFIQASFPEVLFIQNCENLGFSKANNIGVKQAKSDIVYILNPDTIVSEESITQGLNILNSEEKIGAVSFKMIDGSGQFLPESIRSFPDLYSSFTKLFGFGSKKKYYQGLNEENDLEVMPGACMMYKRSVYEQIGGFDERYFMYGEDIDISYQLKQNGYKAKYIEDSPIIHFKGKSSVKSMWNYHQSFYHAMKLYWQKNLMSESSRFSNFLVSLGVEILKIFSFLKHSLALVLFPILDFSFILIFVSAFSVFWSHSVKHDTGFFPSEFYQFILPLYTIASVFSLFVCHFYSSTIDISRLFKASVFNFLLILIIYFILPSEYKYSRAILVYSSLIVFFVPLILRLIYSRIKNIPILFSNNQSIQAKISPDINIDKLVSLIEKYSNYKFIQSNTNSKDIVINCDVLYNSDIIDKLQNKQLGDRIWLYSDRGNYLIQSLGKNEAGFIIAQGLNYKFDNLSVRFEKRLFDVLLSIFILIFSIPISIFSSLSFGNLIRSSFAVLFLEKTWISVENNSKDSVFKIDISLTEFYLRNYSFRLDLYYLYQAMFIS